MTQDFFQHKAGSYEQNKNRVDNVDNIAKTMLTVVRFDKVMHLMDFGSGTGLLLERIAPYVEKITAVDVSASMNEQLFAKREKLSCEVEIKEVDLAKSELLQKFDGIISSMTMHHIEDTAGMFEKFYSMLSEDGFIAVADLDREDGSFHTEDTGVFHSGFDRFELAKIAEDAGFKNVSVTTASVVHKPQGDFPVFLLTAYR